MESRQWPKAEAALRRATALAPDDSLAWGLLGWVLWQEDRGSEAKLALEKGVMLNPDLPELHNYLGSLLSGTGDRAAAEREWREALR
jgi:Flp pilus assembly protein TadD